MSDLSNRDSSGLQWPEDELEYLGHCPLCGSHQRAVLYEGLRDRIFCVPGSWTLHRCEGCSCAYLDPRPLAGTMGKAYKHYFTHAPEDQQAPASLLKRIKQAGKNGYLNRKWATSLSPASKTLGALLLPFMRANLDGLLMRHLARPAGGRTLLDVGCGSGQFLTRARSAGWRVSGFDVDPEAVATARSQGLDVTLGSFETLTQGSECFDAITVSHVIEHFYDPRELLSSCYRLLKPGGYFWIETPNIASVGHLQFKDSWFDLDPPRHLVILNWRALQQMLYDAGFRNIKPVNWRPEYQFRYTASRALRHRKDPQQARQSFLGTIMSGFVESLNLLDHTRREFITLRATK